METKCQHLTMKKRNELIKLLQKFYELFDGTLGTWKTYPVDFKLKYDYKPICLQPYPLTKVHEEIFKKEVERLVLLEVLEVANDSEWSPHSLRNLNLKQIE